MVAQFWTVFHNGFFGVLSRFLGTQLVSELMAEAHESSSDGGESDSGSVGSSSIGEGTGSGVNIGEEIEEEEDPDYLAPDTGKFCS